MVSTKIIVVLLIIAVLISVVSIVLTYSINDSPTNDTEQQEGPTTDNQVATVGLTLVPQKGAADGE